MQGVYVKEASISVKGNTMDKDNCTFPWPVWCVR